MTTYKQIYICGDVVSEDVQRLCWPGLLAITDPCASGTATRFKVLRWRIWSVASIKWGNNCWKYITRLNGKIFQYSMWCSWTSIQFGALLVRTKYDLDCFRAYYLPLFDISTNQKIQLILSPIRIKWTTGERILK